MKNESLSPNPIDHHLWDDFYEYVSTNLGDIPVLDNGKFISRKIHGYWILWVYCKAFPEQEGTMTRDAFNKFVVSTLGEPPEEQRDLITKGRVQRYHQMWRYFGGQ